MTYCYGSNVKSAIVPNTNEVTIDENLQVLSAYLKYLALEIFFHFKK